MIFEPSGDAAGLADRARYALSSLDPRTRTMIERLHGLWDGRGVTLARAGGEFGVTRARCAQIKDRGYARIAKNLDAGSARFEQEMRAAYVRLLGFKGGMARPGEWEDPDSSLFNEHREYCLAFSFLCRACRIKPGSLGTISEDGGCFDSLLTKGRYDKTVAAVTAALMAQERPLPLAGLLMDLRDHGVETDEEFLRRCLQLSPRCGLDENGMASLRSWACFDPKSLSELAHRALLELGKPASLAEILRTIELLFPASAPRLRSLNKALAAHPDRFMLLRYRSYGLRAWGLERVPKCADFLYAELRRRGGRATSKELYAEGRRLHGFRRRSLAEAIRAHPERFQRAQEKVWEVVLAAVPATP